MIAKLRDKVSLIRPETHKKYITNKLNKDISIFRPDIVHRCLLALQDSPLNRAGLLRVFIHTMDGVLIEIDPSCRVGPPHQIPRTENRFCVLMAQVLEKLRVRAVNSSKTLLKVVKNPVTDHFPPDCPRIGTSVNGRLVKLHEYVPKLAASPGPVVLVVGAVSKGDPGKENDYVNDSICISKYNLSASACVARITNSFEDAWGIH